jgi:hypothetical protein
MVWTLSQIHRERVGYRLALANDLRFAGCTPITNICHLDRSLKVPHTMNSPLILSKAAYTMNPPSS